MAEPTLAEVVDVLRRVDKSHGGGEWVVEGLLDWIEGRSTTIVDYADSVCMECGQTPSDSYLIPRASHYPSCSKYVDDTPATCAYCGHPQGNHTKGACDLTFTDPRSSTDRCKCPRYHFRRDNHLSST